MFQSTHSLRSATRCCTAIWSIFFCFNPRTPCGVRRLRQLLAEYGESFQSTHSLRSATCGNKLVVDAYKFQSTHSLRSATYGRCHGECPGAVSIHALLAECDWRKAETSSWLHTVSIHALLAECDMANCPDQDGRFCFNPRTPCGVRLRPTLYIATQQSKSYFAPTSLKRPSLHGCSF